MDPASSSNILLHVLFHTHAHTHRHTRTNTHTHTHTHACTPTDTPMTGQAVRGIRLIAVHFWLWDGGIGMHYETDTLPRDGDTHSDACEYNLGI